MTKREKILQQWEKAVDERIATVEAVLKQYGFVLATRSGSHCTYDHPKLQEAYDKIKNTNVDLREAFGPHGQLTFPIKGGQKVKGKYLRIILYAIEIVSQNQ